MKNNIGYVLGWRVNEPGSNLQYGDQRVEFGSYIFSNISQNSSGHWNGIIVAQTIKTARQWQAMLMDSLDRDKYETPILEVQYNGVLETRNDEGALIVANIVVKKVIED